MYSYFTFALYCLLSFSVLVRSDCPAPTWDRMDDGTWSAVVSTSAEFTHVDVTWSPLLNRIVVPDLENVCGSALVSHSFTGDEDCLTGMRLEYLTEGLWNCSIRTETEETVSYDFTSTFEIVDSIEGENRTQSKTVPITLIYSTTATWSAYNFDATDRDYDASIAQSFTIVVDQSEVEMHVGEVVSQVANYLNISRDYIAVNASTTTGDLTTSLLVLTNDPASGITPTVGLFRLLKASPETLAVRYVLLTPTFNRPRVSLRFPSQKILLNNSTRTLNIQFTTYTSYPGSLTNMSLNTPLTADGIAIEVSSISNVFHPQTSTNLQTWNLNFVVPADVCSFDLPLIAYYLAVAENSTTTYEGEIGFSLAVSNLCPTVQSHALTATGFIYSDPEFTSLQNVSLRFGTPVYAMITLQGNRDIYSAQIQSLTVNDQNNDVISTVVVSNTWTGTPAVTFVKMYDSATSSYRYIVRFQFTVHSGYFIQGQPLFMNSRLSVVYSGTKRQVTSDSAQVAMPFKMAEAASNGVTSAPQNNQPEPNSASALTFALTVFLGLFVAILL